MSFVPYNFCYHIIATPVALFSSLLRSDHSGDLFFEFFQTSPPCISSLSPVVSESNSYLRGPLRGDDHQICRFGVCLFSTQMPFLMELRSMVNMPVVKDNE